MTRATQRAPRPHVRTTPPRCGHAMRRPMTHRSRNRPCTQPTLHATDHPTTHGRSVETRSMRRRELRCERTGVSRRRRNVGHATMQCAPLGTSSSHEEQRSREAGLFCVRRRTGLADWDRMCRGARGERSVRRVAFADPDPKWTRAATTKPVDGTRSTVWTGPTGRRRTGNDHSHPQGGNGSDRVWRHSRRGPVDNFCGFSRVARNPFSGP